jgi:hypothetical protein
VLDYPVVFGNFSVFLAKTINPKTPSAARIGGSTAAERLAQDIRYEQRTLKTQANALQNAGDDALMEDEEVVADDLVQTDFVASDETLDLNVSLFDLTISDFAQEVASFAQEAFYGLQVAAGNAPQQVINALNQATNEVQEAASEFTSTLAGAAEDVADELPAVISSFAEGVGGSIFGVETGIVAAPALAELAYFGVAGIATGVGALVGELDGSGAGSVATQIISDFLQPGQLSNVRYDFGDLFDVNQSNTETDNGSNGQTGSIGTTGSALGGGVYVDRAINGATPTVKLENDIITQNTAGQRSYQLTGYSGSAYGEFPNVVQDYASTAPVYPELQGTVNYDLGDGDVAQASAGGIVSLGTNFIGVRGTITWLASDQVGGAGLPLTTDLIPVQYDETNTSAPIAFESDIQLTSGTGTVDTNTQGDGYDELGQDRLAGNTIDIGAVETDGAPLLSLSGERAFCPQPCRLLNRALPRSAPAPLPTQAIL